MDIRYRGGSETISLLKAFYSAAKIYNAFNVYCRELAPGTVSLTGYRAQGDDSKHCAYCNDHVYICLFVNIEVKTVGCHIQQSGVVLKPV